MKSTKKRPASKGHRRVALLEEEQGKPYLSNRKPGTSKGPTKRNLAPCPTVLCSAKHRSEKRLAYSVRQVLFQTGSGSANGEFWFFSYSETVRQSRVCGQKKLEFWAIFVPVFFGLKIAGWGATAASAGAAYHGGIAAAAAAMKGTTDLGPHSGYHPAHHQLMADMYQGMSPATAINTMDWKNTSQVGLILNLANISKVVKAEAYLILSLKSLSFVQESNEIYV